MKSLLKRLGMLILAVLMTVGMGMTALADEPETTVNIKITGVSNGDSVNAYRLISYDRNSNNYVYENSFKAYLQTQKTDKNQSNEEYLNSLVENGDTTKLSKLMGDYVAECDKQEPDYQLPSPSRWKSAGKDGVVTATDVTPGYYLLLFGTTGTNNKIYNPMTVFVRYDEDKIGVADKEQDGEGYYTMAAKRQDGPTVAHYVWDNAEDKWKKTAAVGSSDTAQFLVKIQIPSYTGIQNVELNLIDQMTNLIYIDDSAALYVFDDSASDKMTGGEISDALTVSDDESGKKFTLSYQNICPQNQERTVVLKFNARITEDALTPGMGKSTATLKYKTTQDSYTPLTSESRETNVYNYGVEINKFKADKTTPLSGAKFAFYKNYTSPNFSDPIKFIRATDADCYRPATAEEIEDDVYTKYTELDSDVKVKGLAEGTFYLVETKAPTSYLTPKSGMQITLIGADNVESELSGELAYAADGSKTAISCLNDADKGLLAGQQLSGDKSNILRVKIINTTIPLLPSTGGAGTAFFTACGVVLMILGVYVFFFRKKEKKQQ